jgi:hypothetical protein
MLKTVSIKNNRLGSQGIRRKWSRKFTEWKRMVASVMFQIRSQIKKSRSSWPWL